MEREITFPWQPVLGSQGQTVRESAEVQFLALLPPAVWPWVGYLTCVQLSSVTRGCLTDQGRPYVHSCHASWVWSLSRIRVSLCNPMDCNPPGSSVHGDSPGQNTGVGYHTLVQGIFPPQGWRPGLPHCRRILSCLSHRGSCFRLSVPGTV